MMSLGAGNETGFKILQGLGFDLSQISKQEIHENFQQIYKLLEQSNNSLDMIMGNTLFFKKSLKLLDLPSDNLTYYYGLEKVPINVRNWTRGSNQINEYIKNKTHGGISDLLLKLKYPANLALVNYIFFTGPWIQGFDPENTKEQNFIVDDQTIVKVPMMFQSRIFNFLYDPILQCFVVELTSMGKNKMLLVLSNREEIGTVINRLSHETLYRWSQSIITSYLDLYVPKLSLSGICDLGDIMKGMGIADLKRTKTNLAGLTGSAMRKLSKVLHMTKLEITEQVTEQDVPTDDTLYRNRRPMILRFDQPFLLMIFDTDTWNILFLGKVIYPV
ncbi:corticosteroid-binding globulin-like [Suncus etruscus]|uniref:corticosteroid-binding globulin-like n=1 Tax=Suncus etruscus TaxID=109475 RepID=UPI0021102DA4|nr:corticosteroid-binding globulin-like [Suncus etruscus]